MGLFLFVFFLPFPGPTAADLACACEEVLYPLLYSTPVGPAVSSSYPANKNVNMRDEENLFTKSFKNMKIIYIADKHR